MQFFSFFLHEKIAKVNAHGKEESCAFSFTKIGCAFSLTFRKRKEYVDRPTQDMPPSPGGGGAFSLTNQGVYHVTLNRIGPTPD